MNLDGNELTRVSVHLLGWDLQTDLFRYEIGWNKSPFERNSFETVFHATNFPHRGVPFERSSVFFQVLIIGLFGLVALAACAEEPSYDQNVQRQDQKAEEDHASLKRDVTEDYAEDAHAPSAAAAEVYAPSAGTAEAYAPAAAYATAPAAAYVPAPATAYATAPAAAYAPAPATAYAAAAVPVGIAAAPSAGGYEPASYPS